MTVAMPRKDEPLDDSHLDDSHLDAPADSAEQEERLEDLPGSVGPSSGLDSGLFWLS